MSPVEPKSSLGTRRLAEALQVGMALQEILSRRCDEAVDLEEFAAYLVVNSIYIFHGPSKQAKPSGHCTLRESAAACATVK